MIDGGLTNQIIASFLPLEKSVVLLGRGKFKFDFGKGCLLGIFRSKFVQFSSLQVRFGAGISMR